MTLLFLYYVRLICPTDLEQRSGRIIRQGNTNPKVEIFRYVTEQTFDAYLYQIVEGKQKFISQIMTSKSPVRSAEDIDETALSYAEIKMLATGNPLIKEKMDLDIQVAKLKMLKQNHLSECYSLEDKLIKTFPREIKSLEERIVGIEKDIATLANNTPKGEEKFLPMTIDGVIYAEKADAGQALIDRCKAMTKPDIIPVGEYRGFAMSLEFDTFAKEYKATLKGEISHKTSLGTDIHGNITRLDNLLEGMGTRLDTAKNTLENTKTQMKNAEIEVKREFPQEPELREKTARLDELNILLNMDKRENEVVDGDIENANDPPAKKEKDMER